MKVSTAFPLIRARHESLTREALRSLFKDQEADVVVAGRPLAPEWDARLAGTIYTRTRNTAADVALKVSRSLRGDFDPEIMDAWLTKNAELAASNINDSTRRSLESADDKQAVFGVILTAGLARYARTLVTTSANFAAKDAARASGAQTKTWSGGSTRHAGLNGETVPMDEAFSNGMEYPGDPAGGAENNANCGCHLDIGG